MLDAFVQGLLLVLQWKALAFMMAGIFVGFWVGLLPGLGGATTLALADRHPELVRAAVLVDVTPGVNGDKAAAIVAFVNGP